MTCARLTHIRIALSKTINQHKAINNDKGRFIKQNILVDI